MEEPIVEYENMQPLFKQMVCLYDIEETTASSSSRQQLLSSPWKSFWRFYFNFAFFTDPDLV